MTLKNVINNHNYKLITKWLLLLVGLQLSPTFHLMDQGALGHRDRIIQKPLLSPLGTNSVMDANTRHGQEEGTAMHV